MPCSPGRRHQGLIELHCFADEAMKRLVLKELPDLETESEAVSTWNIEGWRHLPKRTHGPTFYCGGHPW